MDLQKRIEDALANGREEKIQPLTAECISVHGHIGLQGILTLFHHDSPGGARRKLIPAYLIAAFWGERGIDALVETALDRYRKRGLDRTLSMAARALAGVAVSASIDAKFFDDVAAFWGAERRNEVKNFLAAVSNESGHARRALRVLLLSIDEADAATAGTLASMGLLVHPENVSIQSEIFTALALRSFALGPPVLDAYRHLIDDLSVDEPKLQQFLSMYPQLLEPTAIDAWSKPDLHGLREPDFVIRRQDDSYVVVEIEVPSKPLVAGAQIAAPTSHAIAQAIDYRDCLNRRFADAGRLFPNFHDPDCLVVCGRVDKLTAEQRAILERENKARHKLTIVGFDSLLQRAQTITINLINHTGSVAGARLP